MGSNLMRTATFGDHQVIQTLQRDFVLLWHNQHPGQNPTGEQAPPTAEQAKAYPEGAGGSNVLTYIADPTGRVAYKLTGFWRAERYLAELKFARGLANRLADESPEKVTELIAADHKVRAKAVAGERAELARKHPDEFKKAVRESEVRKKDSALGLLEQSLADSAVNGLKSVSDVFAYQRLKVIA